LGWSPPPPFIDIRRGRVHAREISGVVVFSPNRGRTVSGCCRKYTLEHWSLWRWAWQSSWEPFSIAGIAPASCGSSGWSGGRCREYRPPRFTWRSAEGSADGGLAPVKVRTPPEGCAHVRRGSYSRRSMRSRQHNGGSSAEHVRTVRHRFPQCRYSAGDGGAVIGVDGRDSGRCCCAEWRPDTI